MNPPVFWGWIQSFKTVSLSLFPTSCCIFPHISSTLFLALVANKNSSNCGVCLWSVTVVCVVNRGEGEERRERWRREILQREEICILFFCFIRQERQKDRNKKHSLLLPIFASGFTENKVASDRRGTPAGSANQQTQMILCSNSPSLMANTQLNDLHCQWKISLMWLGHNFSQTSSCFKVLFTQK